MILAVGFAIIQCPLQGRGLEYLTTPESLVLLAVLVGWFFAAGYRKSPTPNSPMTIKPSRDLLLGVGIGIAVGLGIGIAYQSLIGTSGEFSMSVVNEKTIVKINKRTGQTWILMRTNQTRDPGVWVQPDSN